MKPLPISVGQTAEWKPDDGYIVELFDGGPWLSKDLTVTATYAERGVWPTVEAAEAAIAEALKR